MAQPRGTTNKYVSGNAGQRRRRKQWLLDTFGDGEFVACFRQISLKCLIVLDFDTLTVDRVIPGSENGRYVQGNILPVCGSCNSVAGNHFRWNTPGLAGPSREQLNTWAMAPLIQLSASIQTQTASGISK